MDKKRWRCSVLGMKSRFVVLTFFVFLPLVGIGDETDEQYRQLVDETFEVTGAWKIGEQMSIFMVAEMTRALKEIDEEVPDRVYELIASEVNLVIREEIGSGSLNELMYPIYRKYLDASDLEALIKFYTSKKGKKIASLLPQLTQELMIAGQSWGASLGPKVGERVGMRLSEEGIEIPSPPPVANYSPGKADADYGSYCHQGRWFNR